LQDDKRPSHHCFYASPRFASRAGGNPNDRTHASGFKKVAHGEFFGIERLTRLFSTQGPKTPQEIINAIVKDLQTFTGDHSFVDDVSMVVLKV